jgi:hypothetical protein
MNGLIVLDDRMSRVFLFKHYEKIIDITIKALKQNAIEALYKKNLIDIFR